MEYYLPGQRREVFWARFRAFFYGFTIAAFVFTGLGYAWRMAQTDSEHEKVKIELNEKRQIIADLEARLGIKQSKNKRGN